MCAVCAVCRRYIILKYKYHCKRPYFRQYYYNTIILYRYIVHEKQYSFPPPVTSCCLRRVLNPLFYLQHNMLLRSRGFFLAYQIHISLRVIVGGLARDGIGIKKFQPPPPNTLIYRKIHDTYNTQ